jgi:GNAT superfamily N-acetyltransferase
MPPIAVREATAADMAFLQAMVWEAILASPSLIRAMGLEQLQELEDQYWGNWVNEQAPAFIAMDADGQSVGMILLKRNLDQAVAGWRLGIAVAPERRGQGIGRLLLRATATFVRARDGTYLNLFVDMGGFGIGEAAPRCGTVLGIVRCHNSRGDGRAV